MSTVEATPFSLSPASLFIELWHGAGEWTPAQRATALNPQPLIVDAVRSALKQPDAQSSHDALTRLLNGSGTNSAEERGRVLAVMREIDRIFLTIHPRSLSSQRRQVAEHQFRLGFGICGSGAFRRATMGKTPIITLSRAARWSGEREESASNADSPADRFSALAVVPVRLYQEYRPISVTHRVLPAGAARGVIKGPAPGSEVVAFIPVAEKHTDLTATEREISGRKFVDFQPGPDMDAAKRVVEALLQAGWVDIAMAPELVMPEDHADRLADALLSGVSAPPQVVIAGSGSTRDGTRSNPGTRRESQWSGHRTLASAEDVAGST